MSRRRNSWWILAATTVLALPLVAVPAAWAQKYEFKISLDTVPDHPRTWD